MEITSDWDPASVTWNTFSGAFSTDIEGSFVASARQLYSFDIAALFVSWFDDESSNFGVLLEQPDLTTRNGRRNLAILALMYDSGARVQEIIDLTPSSIRLDNPSTVKLLGKGRKARIVPLQEEQTVFLKEYMKENHLLEPYANLYPLFSNSRREKLTRAGVAYILNTYAYLARKINPGIIPEKIMFISLLTQIHVPLLMCFLIE